MSPTTWSRCLSSGGSLARRIQIVEVGPGAQFLTLDEAARRLKITVRELEARAKVAEVGGWGGFVALSEVERLEAWK